MKGKAAISDNAPHSVYDAFESAEFVDGFFQILADAFDVERPEWRPAEYYVQRPDITVSAAGSEPGVEFRLTGASRGTRPPKVFHDALSSLQELMIETAARGLAGTTVVVQVFPVILTDGDVPAHPKLSSFSYSPVLELDAVWVGENGLVEGDSAKQAELHTSEA